MYAWHVHHMLLYETLKKGGLTERQRYIRTEKPSKERPRRLRLLKAVKNQQLLTDLDAAKRSAYPDVGLQRQIYRVITTLHNQECKRCPWDGKTIFPRKVK